MIRIFVSYSHRDGKHKERFISHLESLNLHGVQYHAISDSDIPAGVDWRVWLDKEMEGADIGVFLVSRHFLSSEFCAYEMALLGQRLHDKAIPILVSDCDWDGVPALSARNFANREPIEVAEDVDSAWKAVIGRVRNAYRDAAKRATRRHRLPTPQLTRRVAPRDVKHELADILHSGGGAFTPLLGSGAHDPDNRQRALDHVRVRLDWLLQTLTDSRAKVYAEEVVEANLEGVKRRPSPDERPSEAWMDDLVVFQGALAELGAHANQAFVTALIKQRIPITDIRSLKVEIDDASELRRLFFNATARATELLECNTVLKKESANMGLGATGIREQLVALTWAVFRPDLEGAGRSSECQAWIDSVGDIFEDVVFKMKLPLRRLEKRPILALSHVEWLGDLLWHTFRFQAPIYPDPTEMAFQISVCTRQFTPPRREMVGTVASLVGNLEELVYRVRGWLDHYSSKTTVDGGCYSAIAAALCHRLPSPASSHEDRSVYEAAIELHQRLWPIAVSTNFDNDLERALNRAERSHHVIFPVYMQRNESLVKADWLLRSDDWINGQSIPSWRLLGDTSVKELINGFDGPLIVKLHGSPLTTIVPKLVNDEKGNKLLGYSFVHRLILSDVDFFEEMVSDQRSWPDGLAKVLYQSQRTLCFLGYPLADFNNRLRLYDQVYRREKRETDRIFVIDHPEDPIYSGFLKRIEATPVAMTLEDVMRLINDNCDPL